MLPMAGLAAQNEWLEAAFWCTSAGVAIWQARRNRGVFRYYFWAVAAVGTAGLLADQHAILHAGFYGVAAGALYLLLRKRITHNH